MLKLNHLKPLILIVVSLFIIPAVFAGKPDSLNLKGMVFNDDNIVKNVIIKIYDHNKLIKKVHVKSSNRFMTNLPLNSFVTVEITAKDFHTKRFIIDTKVPKGIKRSQLKYNFDIDIFKEEELADINTSFLDFPVGLVSFDKKKGAFLRNKKYTKRMKKAYLRLWAESQAAQRQSSEGLK